ncbi:MAG: nitroreductase family protein [Gammaproteobacteria bacterium]|nr:nitroreductase family protein [Gammaproteobacteria bacterium]
MLFSEQQKVFIKQRIEAISSGFSGFFSRHRWLASCYYFCLSSQFHREHLATLKGKAAYRQNLKLVVKSSALLRRNIHRLEKGLIMQPRRPVFASDYIGETIQHYVDIRRYPDFHQPELRWAFQVLTNYFSVVSSGQNSLVDAARQAFHSTAIVDCDGLTPAIPYTRQQTAMANVDFASLEQLFRQRRSVRWFLKKPVDTDLIRQAVNAASQAPSACNRQPFRFDLINNNTNAAKIASLAMGTTGFAENIPCLLVVVGDLSCYPAERDRHVIYIDASLATMQLMLALETLGLSTCPINWPDIEFREKLMQQKLGLKIYERPVMLLAVGYADPEGGIAYSQKKDDQLLVREIYHVD